MIKTNIHALSGIQTNDLCVRPTNIPRAGLRNQCKRLTGCMRLKTESIISVTNRSEYYNHSYTWTMELLLTVYGNAVVSYKASLAATTIF
jgi:hypothetical protein